MEVIRDSELSYIPTLVSPETAELLESLDDEAFGDYVHQATLVYDWLTRLELDGGSVEAILRSSGETVVTDGATTQQYAAYQTGEGIPMDPPISHDAPRRNKTVVPIDRQAQAQLKALSKATDQKPVEALDNALRYFATGQTRIEDGYTIFAIRKDPKSHILLHDDVSYMFDTTQTVLFNLN